MPASIRGAAEAQQVESYIHFDLAKRRLVGEWFDVSVQAGVTAVDNAFAVLDLNREETAEMPAR